MKKLWLTCCLVLILYLESSLVKAQPARKELILKWKSEYLHLATSTAWLKKLTWAKYLENIELKQRFAQIPQNQTKLHPKAVDLSTIYTLYYSSPLPQFKIIRFLQSLPYFEYVEPLPTLIPFSTGYRPNDPLLNNHLTFSRIRAFEAWELQKGDTNITIAVVDSEIAWDHPDLENNIKINYQDPINGIDDDNDGYRDNYRGWDLAGEALSANQPDNDTRSLTNFAHGTQVAGFAAAVPDNNIGIAGTGFRTKILPVKVTPDIGPGNTNMSYGYDGIIYAANAGAHIINCSFGGSEFSRFGLDAVMYATYNKNALVVAAGGNVLGDTTFYPAGFSEVLAVASLDYQDVIQTSYGCHIDISTPSGGVGLLRPNQYQNTAIGVASSWAAPLVSGAAALVKAHFPNYTALQIAEKLRVAANAEIYQVNNGLNYENKLGKGRLDMYQALTLESPSVRVSGLNFEDNNDNIPTAGDTVLLKIQLTNYLLATTQLSVLLEVHSPFVEILNSRNLIGALQTQEEKVVTFRIYLRPNIPQNFKAYFTLSYEDPNLEYKAKECFPVLLNITFVNISNEKIATTVNSVGNFGFNDVGVNSQGIGFTFLGKNQLYLGGFVAGTSPNTTVDNLINQTGRPQRDFRPLQPLLFQRPGRIANEEVIAYFDDGGAGQNRIPIRIKNQASIFSGVGKDQFVLMEYTLFNPSPRTISNLYAGIFADWDIGEEATNDNTNFIAEENLAYAYDNENNTPILGIKALQPQAAVHASGQMNTYSNYTKTAKFRNISSGQNNANIEDTDIIQYLATGPYEIPAQDSITLRFALLAGHTLEDIKQQGKIAEKIYCDFTQAGIYSINLGKDTTSCTPIFLGGKIAQAVHYQWSEGSMAPQLWVWESGKYSLTVYDSKGCQLSDTIEVNIVPFKAEFKVSDTLLIPPQDLLTVKDTTPGAISWFWDFGDGNTATTPVAEHRYAQDGTYTLTLIVSNGTCYDTVQKIIRRQTPTSMLVNNFTSSLILFPNPIIRNNKFSIQGLLTNEKATIMLQDLAGKIIAQWQEKEISSGYLELQIPQLPQGIYYLCIQSSLRNQTLKLLIGTNVDD